MNSPAEVMDHAHAKFGSSSSSGPAVRRPAGRRIPDYATQFTDWNIVSSIGGWIYGVSQLLFVYVIWKSVTVEAPAPSRVWEGA